jgi:NAD(P) transhydrogenase subunit beta
MNNIIALSISQNVYYIISTVLALSVMFGLFLMSKVENAKLGNSISALAILIGVVVSLIKYNILPIWLVYICLAIGIVIGLVLALKVKMIQMPELIALLNGLGGLSSVIVGGYALLGIGSDLSIFSEVAAMFAIIIGGLTFIGSMVAAGKLHRIITQKPIIIKMHQTVLGLLVALMILTIVLRFSISLDLSISLIIFIVLSFIFGALFAIRIGGADMPITISLLNSLSGVAAAISGLAIGDVLLVSIGGIVGASGLLLTQIMCKAMNRNLFEILSGNTMVKKIVKAINADIIENIEEVIEDQKDFKEVVKNAKNIIIVPGYGMAVAQAQHILKQVADDLKKKGANIRFAIHPVAGRMPGHMNVLLAEANVDYDDLYEMDDLNDEFRKIDLTIVVGANDVLNPAARLAEGTPIYGMPILNVDQCKYVFIFNFDSKPGYSGVLNPLYDRKNGIYSFFGNAHETLQIFLKDINV